MRNLMFECQLVQEVAAVRRAWEIPTTFLPGVDGPVIRPARPAAPKESLRETVERYLQDRQIPYVDVDEAERTLHTSTKLGLFHFVAYGRTGPNWLIWAAPMQPAVREDMAAWEKVFGEGFVAAIATEEPAGNLSFHTLAGAAMEIE